MAMCDFMLQNIRINTDILSDSKYDYLFTVEDVNRLALSGKPFRDAYREVGMQVQRGEYKPTKEVHHTHEGSIGNLCNGDIAEKMREVVEQMK
jgi:argininosuccinate lyase